MYLNQLSGPIPASLGNITSLQYLYESVALCVGGGCERTAELTVDDACMHRWLRSNRLTGPIPDSLGRLSNLLQMYALLPQRRGFCCAPSTDRCLCGACACACAGWGSYLFDNQLTGPIPSTFSGLTQLSIGYGGCNGWQRRRGWSCGVTERNVGWGRTGYSPTTR